MSNSESDYALDESGADNVSSDVLDFSDDI